MLAPERPIYDVYRGVPVCSPGPKNPPWTQPRADPRYLQVACHIIVGARAAQWEGIAGGRSDKNNYSIILNPAKLRARRVSPPKFPTFPRTSIKPQASEGWRGCVRTGNGDHDLRFRGRHGTAVLRAHPPPP